MLEAQTLHPKELCDADVRLWRQFALAHADFSSPLLGPDFAQAAGAIRDDARVAVLRQDGRTVAFLAHHRRPGGMARPIAAPLSDYHGIVSDPAVTLTAAQVLEAAGLSAYRFTGLIDPHGLFAGQVTREQEAHVVHLESSADAYLEALRAASPKKMKNYRRLAHKLDREVGELRIAAPDDSQAAYDTLIAWKRDQLRRTGTHDFLGPDWVRALFQSLFERRDGGFQGLMVNLYAGDRLVAGHFGVRLDGVYHPWLASADPDLPAYSLGQVFLMQAIAEMPRLGLVTYDLGPGHDHYKKAYALLQRPIGEGLAVAGNRAGEAQRGWEGVWTLAGANGHGMAARLRRRLDVIATTELTFAGRARGFAVAIADQARKSRAVQEAD